MNQALTKASLLQRFESLGLAFETFSHEAVFTVMEAQSIRERLPPGAHSKNLFLRNKRGRQWLVTCLEDRPVDLKALAKRLDAGRLSFGSPDRLGASLGVTPGSVTPFSVVNDPDGAVELVIDRVLLDYRICYFHPLENTATTAMAPSDLLIFIRSTGHEPRIIDFDLLTQIDQ